MRKITCNFINVSLLKYLCIQSAKYYQFVNCERCPHLRTIVQTKQLIGLHGHLPKVGKDLNPLCRRYLNGNETVEHLLCECESLIISTGRICGQSFGELQQLSHVPVDLLRLFATEIGLAGK